MSFLTNPWASGGTGRRAGFKNRVTMRVRIPPRPPHESMRLVFDTSTLQAAWRGGVLGTLPAVCRELLLPQSVVDETRHSRAKMEDGRTLVPDVDALSFTAYAIPYADARDAMLELIRASWAQTGSRRRASHPLPENRALQGSLVRLVGKTRPSRRRTGLAHPRFARPRGGGARPPRARRGRRRRQEGAARRRAAPREDAQHAAAPGASGREGRHGRRRRRPSEDRGDGVSPHPARPGFVIDAASSRARRAEPRAPRAATYSFRLTLAKAGPPRRGARRHPRRRQARAPHSDSDSDSDSDSAHIPSLPISST